MTKNPVVIEVPSTKREVLKIMTKYQFSGYPVVDARTKKLVGIITRKDLLKKREEDQTAMLMTPNPIVVTPKTGIKTAAKLMYEHNIHRLPVVDKEGRVIGIVTDRDVLSYLVVQKIDVPINTLVEKVCVPVYDGTPINVLAEIMEISQIYAFPVLDSEANLVGIVTDRDLIRVSEIKDEMRKAEAGMSSDEDSWSWEGVSNMVTFYYLVEKLTWPKRPISEVMVKDVHTIYYKAPAWEAAKVMIEKDFDQLPMIDHHDRLVGMITTHDLLKAVFK